MQDLQAISQEIHKQFLSNKPLNTPELVILPINPFRLYTAWNLGSEYIIDHRTLVLRLYWLADDIGNREPSKLWFDQVLDSRQGQREIQLPIDDTRYSAAIGLRDQQHKLTILLRVKAITMPSASAKPATHQALNLASPIQQFTPISVDRVHVEIKPRHYDELMLDRKIRASVLNRYKPSPQSQFLYNDSEVEQNIIIRQKGQFDETVIDALIQQIFARKGRKIQLTSIATTTRTHLSTCNASGQNF